MSEVFDPDKVKSYYQPVGWEPHEVVAKADYDKLLALYVAAMRIVRSVGMEVISIDIP